MVPRRVGGTRGDNGRRSTLVGLILVTKRVEREVCEREMKCLVHTGLTRAPLPLQRSHNNIALDAHIARHFS